MQTLLKLPLLKFAIMGIVILTAFPLAAQQKKLHLDQVTHAEKELPDLSIDTDKVDLLLDISNWYFDVHTPKVQNLNKASKFALKALNDSKLIDYQKGIGESYLLLSMISQESKNYQQGKIYATKAVNTFSKLGVSNRYGEALVMLWSTSTLTNADYSARVNLLKSAANAFSASGNKKRQGDCLKEMGDIHQIHGDYANAVVVLEKALVLYKKANFRRIPEVYDLIGRVYLLMGNLDKGIKNILEAEKLADEFNAADDFRCTLYNSIAMAYSKFKQTEKAIPYIRKALQIAIKSNDTTKMKVVLVNNVYMLLKVDKTNEALTLLNSMVKKYPRLKSNKNPMLDCLMADIYIERKDLDKAAHYCALAEIKIKKYGTELDTDDAFGFMTTIIRYNIAARHYEKASLYNAKYDSICNLKDRTFCQAYYFWEFKIDSAAGNYLSAIKNFQRFKKINDDMFSQAKTTEINQLSILHESEKKDKNIQLLKQQAVAQQNNLKAANFVRNTTLLGLFLMSVFIFILYRSYRLNYKANIALKAQKEEINHKNEILQHLVTEKEWLLKEIHHRVKNNLHMVVGLLASQAEYLKGKEAVQAMNESQRRVEAMSIIHQKLYQSDNLSMIDMPSYIYELTENLSDSLKKGQDIRFQLDICNVEFPLSHSIPVGLILNEAITNAIKYAFPDGKGIIEIVLMKEESGNFLLRIKDNGVGIGKDFDIEECSSLGLKLIQGLTDDMQGDFKIMNNNGTIIELRFMIKEDNMTDLKII